MRKEGDNHCGLSLRDTDICAYTAGRQEERKEADNPLLLLSVTQSDSATPWTTACQVSLSFTIPEKLIFFKQKIKKKEFIILED